MWFFKKNKSQKLKEEIESVVAEAIKGHLVSKQFDVDNDIAEKIKEDFVNINSRLLDSFKKTCEIGETNTSSIATLAQSIQHLVNAYTDINTRLQSLESKLSMTGIKLTYKD